MSKGPAVLYLIAATQIAVEHFIRAGAKFPDSNTSQGFGQICEGLIQLLNEDITPLDGGKLWQEIAEIAERVAWSLDESEIDYG